MSDPERLAQIFTALGNGLRLQLMSEVASQPHGESRSVSSLAAALEISRFTASHHLAVLRSANLVDAHKDGLSLRHQVNASTMMHIEDWYLAFLDTTTP